MNFATVGGRAENYEEENAYKQWCSLTESCYYALKAYGTNKVLLTQHEDLISRKEMVIKKCLSFVYEEYDANCLDPFDIFINSSRYDRSKIDFSIDRGLISEKKYIQDACLLYMRVLNDSYDEKGSLRYYRILRDRYLQQAKYFY
jgi:hypothetical protein